MKQIFTLLLLLYFSNSFSQWTRVQQLPSSDITSLYWKGNTLYAGGKSIIYFSKNKGRTWDSTNRIPQFSSVDNIVVYRNELYAASYSFGVYKSRDGGITWKNINAGLFPFVSDFTIFEGNLYASTLGSSVFKLEPVNHNSWSSFNNGLSSLSLNITSIASNSKTMIAGTNNNGLYDYLPPKSTTWQERFLLGRLKPSEGVFDIVTAHDSLYLAGHSGLFYLSTNNGKSWSFPGNTLHSTSASLVNAKQAFLLASNNFNGLNNTSFYYIKKDSLFGLFTFFSAVPDHYTYKLEIFGDKLWDASTKGLFFMPLSLLPGITAADDSINPIILPVHFMLVNATCEGSKVVITWKTVQEQNSSHYNVERSVDGSRWTTIDNEPAAGKSITETSHAFTDNSPLQNGLYRIAEYDLDGKAQYSNVLRSSCAAADVFSLWPNPVHDIVFINIVSGSASQALIKLFNSKGALVKVQKLTVLQGYNRLSLDMKLLANGVYHLSVEGNNGQMQSMQVLKQ